MIKTATAPSLTDTQHQLLSAALLRPDGAVALTDRLKGKAAAKVGQALIGKALVREIRTRADLPAWRQDADTGRSFSLVLTKAGRTAVAPRAEPAAPRIEPTTSTDDARIAASPTADAPTSAAPAPRSGSKLAAVMALLRRDEGCSVTELMATTGGLPHTTRAALTGLRKRGYDVTREAAQGGSVYRVTESTAAAA